MAIPSGSGTEVLKRASVHGNSGAWTNIIIGVANHIYTVISLICCEQAAAAETIHWRIDKDAAGSNQIQLLSGVILPGEGTYVWNDRFVMTGTDKLQVYNSAGNCDWWVSYIDQDWT